MVAVCEVAEGGGKGALRRWRVAEASLMRNRRWPHVLPIFWPLCSCCKASFLTQDPKIDCKKGVIGVIGLLRWVSMGFSRDFISFV